MQDDNPNAFFVGSLVASVVGAVMLLADDFGGWYFQISYAGVLTDGYGHIGLISVYFPVVVVLAAALLYSRYVSYSALRSIVDDAQLTNIDLRSSLQEQRQLLQLMSNASEMLHDTAMAVIRKIG